MKMIPKEHEEIHIDYASIVIKKYEEFYRCGKGEYEVINYAKNITFNDVFVTYTDYWNEGHYIQLDGRFIEVYPCTFDKDKIHALGYDRQEQEVKENQDNQMTIFDFLEVKNDGH